MVRPLDWSPSARKRSVLSKLYESYRAPAVRRHRGCSARLTRAKGATDRTSWNSCRCSAPFRAAAPGLATPALAHSVPVVALAREDRAPPSTRPASRSEAKGGLVVGAETRARAIDLDDLRGDRVPQVAPHAPARDPQRGGVAEAVLDGHAALPLRRRFAQPGIDHLRADEGRPVSASARSSVLGFSPNGRSNRLNTPRSSVAGESCVPMTTLA